MNSGVLADGCFDPIHYGHVRYLKAARDLCKYGESLMVRIAPDEFIWMKHRTAFQNREERGLTVMGIVDCVLDHSDLLPQAIRNLKPRLLVKGIEWQGRLVSSVLDACEEHGTHLVFVNTRERSSSERISGRDLGDENDRR